MNHKKAYNAKNLCCICLKKKSALQSIFVELEEVDNLCVARIIETFSQFKACNPDDRACAVCVKLSKDVLNFKVLIEKSYLHLGSFVVNHVQKSTQTYFIDEEIDAFSQQSVLDCQEEVTLKEFTDNSAEISSPGKGVFKSENYEMNANAENQLNRGSNHTPQSIEYETELEIVKGELKSDERVFVETIQPLIIRNELLTSINEQVDIQIRHDTNFKPQTRSNSDCSDCDSSKDPIDASQTSERMFVETTHDNKTSEYLENQCSICSRKFSRQCHLKRHMQSAHLKLRPHICQYCQRSFTRSDHLKIHVLNLHTSKKHKCEMCSKTFIKENDLKHHKEVRHSDSSNYTDYQCGFCKKKFSAKTCLEKHVLLHGSRVYTCRFCDETFEQQIQLKEHAKCHKVSKRNFLCSICGESFTRNDYLRVHLRRHLGEKPYKCQFCSKGFPRATDVRVHERYHTDTKPNICTFCGKGFHRAYNLTIHLRTHTGEKPFACMHCPKSFSQSNDLKAHVRRHTGERFKCESCSASFIQKYSLRQHALAAHGIHMKSLTGRLNRSTSVKPFKQEEENCNSVLSIQQNQNGLPAISNT